MTITTVYSTIMNHFSSSWAAGVHNAVPVLYRNESSKPPDNAPWLELDIVWGPGRIASNNSNILQGNFVSQCYTPKGQGIASSSLLADEARRVIVSASLAGIRFNAPSGPINVPNDSLWFQRVISCPFQFDSDTT